MLQGWIRKGHQVREWLGESELRLTLAVLAASAAAAAAMGIGIWFSGQRSYAPRRIMAASVVPFRFSRVWGKFSSYGHHSAPTKPKNPVSLPQCSSQQH